MKEVWLDSGVRLKEAEGFRQAAGWIEASRNGAAASQDSGSPAPFYFRCKRVKQWKVCLSHNDSSSQEESASC